MLTDLYKRYAEPHRHYHNLNHIMSMFNYAKQLGISLSDAQIWAIWGHDVVYDVPQQNPGDNEKFSAAWTVAHMAEQEIRQSMINKTETIILDTFKEIPTIEESRAVIDLDLFELSISKKYWTNKDLIKKEVLTGATETQWNEGRPKWLQSMLDRDTIFVSKYATKDMEKVARNNIMAELEIIGESK